MRDSFYNISISIYLSATCLNIIDQHHGGGVGNAKCAERSGSP